MTADDYKASLLKSLSKPRSDTAAAKRQITHEQEADDDALKKQIISNFGIDKKQERPPPEKPFKPLDIITGDVDKNWPEIDDWVATTEITTQPDGSTIATAKPIPQPITPPAPAYRTRPRTRREKTLVPHQTFIDIQQYLTDRVNAGDPNPFVRDLYMRYLRKGVHSFTKRMKERVDEMMYEEPITTALEKIKVYAEIPEITVYINGIQATTSDNTKWNTCEKAKSILSHYEKKQFITVKQFNYLKRLLRQIGWQTGVS